jgi:E3 ubiquitin-protein ligase RNF14
MRAGKEKSSAYTATSSTITEGFDTMDLSNQELSIQTPEDLPQEDERVLEISTIAVIYPEFSKHGRVGGSLDIEVNSSEPIKTLFTLFDGDEQTREDTLEISHLPPIKFEFQLPKSYPYDAPPNIRLTSDWLEDDVLLRLKEELYQLWDSLRDQSIFASIDTLQSAADRLFDLATDPLEIEVFQKEKIKILEYDSATRRKRFNDGTFDCEDEL